MAYPNTGFFGIRVRESGGRRGDCVERNLLASEVQIRAFLFVEEHRDELDPLGSGERAGVRGGVENNVAISAARARAPRISKHDFNLGVRTRTIGPVRGSPRASLCVDLLTFLQLLHARRVHGLGVDEFDFVAQTQHLQKRHRRRAGQRHAGHRDGEVLGVGGNRRAVVVRRGFCATAQTQDVRLRDTT